MADTEFLFGMRSSDSKYKAVRAILDELERLYPNRVKELLIPPIAIFEVIIVCISQGVKLGDVVNALTLFEDIMSRYKLGFMKFGLRQVIRGLSLYGGFKRSFFDSLIAGSALEEDGIIVGDDEAFLNIPGLRRMTLREYLDDLSAR